MAFIPKGHVRLPLDEIDLNVEYLESPAKRKEVMIQGRVSTDVNQDATYSDIDLEDEAIITRNENDTLLPSNSSLGFDLNMLSFESGEGSSSIDLNRDFPVEDMDDLHGSHEVRGALSLGEEEIRDKKRCRNLTNVERRAVYEALLQRSVNMQLKHGTTKIVAQLYSTSIRTVQRIWQIAKLEKTSRIMDVSHKKTKNCGRKRIQVDIDQIREIPLSRRTTLESLACAARISKTSLFGLLKSGVLRRHSNAIKSDLTEENKKARLSFCLSMLEQASLPHDLVFSDVHHIVHIDEKWFYMTKKSENYYLVWDEEEPLRTCKSKNFIGKVMFLVVVARPRFDANGKEIFSGKIGVFPFVTKEPAKRTSANRVAGTLETKPITSVGKDVSRSFLIEKVIPEIRAKWPKGEKGPIFIQQDNARTHIRPDDHKIVEAASRDGFDIRLMCQPPNSPDLNVLDLGFFSAIQALQYKECPKTVDGLVNAVVRSSENFSTIKSNRVFLTLQLCMLEIMKAGGSNKYRIPHVNKEMLGREMMLPVQFKCDASLVQDVISRLGQSG